MREQKGDGRDQHAVGLEKDVLVSPLTTNV